MTSPSPLADPAPWNLVDEWYAERGVHMLHPYARDAIALAAPAADARVLDVACGPGTLALLVAPAVAQVAALDFAAAMIDRLRERAERAGLVVDARVGDGQDLPWPDASFDAAFSMFGLIFFPDPARGLRELHRVLRPGGRAVVGSWSPFAESHPLSLLFTALRAVMPELPLGRGPAPLSQPDEFAAALAAAGFTGVRVEPVTHEFHFADVAAFWTFNVRGNAPIALIHQRLAPEQWQAFEADVLARLRERFGAGPVVYGQTALLGLGVR
ncbi:Ubiquinone/menaquinone biosynthesis C-methylase UbiE [Nannocystis exedens]|uniref:Ubiquinone/menaquinone biosynthesis C-methylase UbiE n=1 Tax=Nannocystis exedens TaxID=54 RepID=A0A1I2D5E9_9BACT|nr:class I SAM-dependent methyltransferase [Nannocystis exedens]PCC70722.1 SAM-dependent methyltransferase [Nannocystis exedens]SFE75746.1 Ubiquinone/menaquinone biosynthesis C-methylase UbiE [Nannocystis exedens]